MSALQHRKKRINKYLAKFQARLRVADRDAARIEALCGEKSGDIRAEWDAFLGLHIESVSGFKEELADYTRMRDDTLRMQSELGTLQPQASSEKLEIEKQISAVLGAQSMHLEQVVMNFAECLSELRDYESALKAVEYAANGADETNEM